MKMVLFAAVIAAMLVFGCTSQAQPASPAGNNETAAPQNTDTQVYVPNENVPGEVVVGGEPQKTNESNVQPPNSGEPNVGVAEFCPGKIGSDLVECTFMQAVGAKNVSVCTGLSGKQDRFDCIAKWCASSARDFFQCEALAAKDDKEACLNRCMAG